MINTAAVSVNANEKREAERLDISLYHRLLAAEGCESSLEWALRYAAMPFSDGWESCNRGDWMLFLAAIHSGEPCSEYRRKLSLCAAECARLHSQARNRGFSTLQNEILQRLELWARRSPGIIIDHVKYHQLTTSVASINAACRLAFEFTFHIGDHAKHVVWDGCSHSPDLALCEQAAEVVRRWYSADDMEAMFAENPLQPRYRGRSSWEIE